MPSINRSDCFADRATHGGKGDLFRGDRTKFRNARIWWRSECCNAPVVHLGGCIGPDAEDHSCTECECFTHIKDHE